MYFRRLLFLWAFFFILPSFAAKVAFDKACLQEVLSLIQSAKKELVISIFDLNEPKIIDAILDAHFRGVKIQVLADRRQGTSEHSRIPDLYLLGIDVRLNSKKKLNHHKFAVADGKKSVSGSFNWTVGASRSNAEDITLLEAGILPSSEERAIKQFQKKFQEDWSKNSSAKSDGYFKTFYDKNSEKVFTRWRPWILETLNKPEPKNAVEAGRLLQSFKMLKLVAAQEPAYLDLVARHASSGGKQALSVRIAALKLLGDARTTAAAHHELIANAENDSRKIIRQAASYARIALGGELQTDPSGTIRSLRVFCNSWISRLSLALRFEFKNAGSVVVEDGLPVFLWNRTFDDLCVRFNF